MNVIDSSHTNKKSKPDIVEGLIQMFDKINKLAKKYRNIKDNLEDSSLLSFNTAIFGRQSIDGRQYELPISDEIAGLIVGDNEEINSIRDVVIQSNYKIFKMNF